MMTSFTVPPRGLDRAALIAAGRRD